MSNKTPIPARNWHIEYLGRLLKSYVSVVDALEDARKSPQRYLRIVAPNGARFAPEIFEYIGL
jgi:hypothetical protein